MVELLLFAGRRGRAYRTEVHLELLEQLEDLGEQVVHAARVLELLRGGVATERGPIQAHADRYALAVATLGTRGPRLHRYLTVALCTLRQLAHLRVC